MLAQVLNWIAWRMPSGKSTEIRLTESEEKDVYTLCIKNTKRKGLLIKHMKIEPTLTGKILQDWSNFVTYETLSLFEIKASIECAHTLNSFNEDILLTKIDDLVNEALSLELPMYDENIFNCM